MPGKPKAAKMYLLVCSTNSGRCIKFESLTFCRSSPNELHTVMQRGVYEMKKH